MAGALIVVNRIIPACAGNGRQFGAKSCHCADHPRVCGERFGSLSIGFCFTGSSPRVRGTGHPRQSPASGERIIPACAGNGMKVCFSLMTPADHPRVCGERSSFPSWSCVSCGSSPRVRGTGRMKEFQPGAERIIPACAGNGSVTGWPRVPRSDHPRVCGERARANGPRVRGAGSSPRVRGTAGGESVVVGPPRIIPACAGNGCQPYVPPVPLPDHPRVCGERLEAQDQIKKQDGSSPRVRGTAREDQRHLVILRIIPACAGNGGHAGD